MSFTREQFREVCIDFIRGHFCGPMTPTERIAYLTKQKAGYVVYVEQQIKWKEDHLATPVATRSGWKGLSQEAIEQYERTYRQQQEFAREELAFAHSLPEDKP